MVRNTGSQTKKDLQDRLFYFAVSVIELVRELPKQKEYDIFGYQLIKSSTSSGANYQEAQGAISKADFTNKVSISLKEMLESIYWIKLIIETTDQNSGWINILHEAIELKKILGSIYSKTSNKH